MAERMEVDVKEAFEYPLPMDRIRQLASTVTYEGGKVIVKKI